MKYKFSGFYFSQFLLISSAIAQLEVSWKKIDSKDSVEIYRGEVKDSHIVAFRGTSTLEAPIENVLSVIHDKSRIKEWMSSIVEIRRLQDKSKFEQIEYNRTKAPWPLADRDFVYETSLSLKPEEGIVEVFIKSTKHPNAPLVNGVVRGELHQSRYFLKSVEDGKKTYIEVEILADPKGSLPKWVVNLFQESWPVKTVNGIRKISTEEGYSIHPDIAESLKVNKSKGPSL